MLFAMKTGPEEKTAGILGEIERAEKIFKKICEAGEPEEEARPARRAAVASRRVLR